MNVQWNYGISIINCCLTYIKDITKQDKISYINGILTTTRNDVNFMNCKDLMLNDDINNSDQQQTEVICLGNNCSQHYKQNV